MIKDLRNAAEINDTTFQQNLGLSRFYAPKRTRKAQHMTEQEWTPQNNMIPWGLLRAEYPERADALREACVANGASLFSANLGWWCEVRPDWVVSCVYRAKPAPEKPERVEIGLHIDKNGHCADRWLDEALRLRQECGGYVYRITHDPDGGNAVLEEVKP